MPFLTFEELKEEAKRQGYNLIRIKKPEKLLPCTCGCNRREHWHCCSIENGEFIKLICCKCGKEAIGKTMFDAIHNWNEMIKKERAEE